MYGQEERDVKCPFFVRMMPNKIICEGYFENSTLQLVLGDDKDRKKYLQCFCNSLETHGACPIFKMLNEFWEALEDE